MENISLNTGNVCANIALGIGNNLYALTINGKELLYFPYPIHEYSLNNKLAGNPLMHPWANRIKSSIYTWNDNSIDLSSYGQYLFYDTFQQPLHGLLLKSSQWKIIDRGAEFLVTQLLWNEKLPYYGAFPFEHTLTIIYTIHENGITLLQRITNYSQHTMPISTGFHPYFIYDYKKRKEIKLNLGFTKYLVTDDQLIPTGDISATSVLLPRSKMSLNHLNLDHGFISQNQVITVEFPGYTLFIEGEGYPYWVVYTPNHHTKPYLCIEPVTAPTNGFNLYQKFPTRFPIPQINPQESYEAKFSITMRNN